MTEIETAWDQVHAIYVPENRKYLHQLYTNYQQQLSELQALKDANKLLIEKCDKRTSCLRNIYMALINLRSPAGLGGSEYIRNLRIMIQIALAGEEADVG